MALAKFLNNKRCPQAIYEAMECLGGVGYVEEGPMPLLYREAPLNSIWEGSGNVICLDVLRTLARDADARTRLDAELDAARGRGAAYDAALDGSPPDLARAPPPRPRRASFVERLATLLAAARPAPGRGRAGRRGLRRDPPRRGGRPDRRRLAEAARPRAA